jgi:hypothetical protein
MEITVVLLQLFADMNTLGTRLTDAVTLASRLAENECSFGGGFQTHVNAARLRTGK